jgi:hypothetical protein
MRPRKRFPQKPRKPENPAPPPGPRSGISLDFSLLGIVQAVTQVLRFWYRCEKCKTEASGSLPPAGIVYHCAECHGPMLSGRLSSLKSWQGKDDRTHDVTFEDVTYPRLGAGRKKGGK